METQYNCRGCGRAISGRTAQKRDGWCRKCEERNRIEQRKRDWSAARRALFASNVTPPDHSRERLVQSLRERAVDSSRATDMAKLGPFPHFAPATHETIAECESQLGLELPGIYRDVLLNVGNGGFGPGYGILGIGEDGAHDDLGRDLVDRYENHKLVNTGYAHWHWPFGMLPFCYYGCDIYACVNCMERPFPVYSFDPSHMEQSVPLPDAYLDEAASLEGWFSGWVSRTNEESSAGQIDGLN